MELNANPGIPLKDVIEIAKETFNNNTNIKDKTKNKTKGKKKNKNKNKKINNNQEDYLDQNY